MVNIDRISDKSNLINQRFGELRRGHREAGVKFFTPHEKQAMFMESCFNNRETWGFAGNRSGKTEPACATIAAMATGEYPQYEYGTGRKLDIRWKHRPGQKFWVCAQTTEKLREVIQPKLLRWLPKRFIRKIHKQAHDLIDFIVLNDDSRIVLKNYAQDVETFEGDDIDAVFFDEQPKWAQYKATMMRLIDRAGHVFGALTPVEGFGWVYREIYKRRDIIGAHCFNWDMDDNPFIAQKEKDAFLAHLTADEIKVRKEGKFVALHGLIYPMFTESSHVVDDFPIPSDWVKITATDPHLKKPMSTIWMTVAPNDCEFDGRQFNAGDIFVYREMKFEGIIPDAVVAFKLAESNHNERIKARLGDPALNIKTDNFRGLDTFAEFARYGWTMYPANKDVFGGIKQLRALMGVSPPKFYVFRSCRGTQEEFYEYKYKDIGDDVAKNYSEKILQQYDDYLDPVRYVINSKLLEARSRHRHSTKNYIYSQSGRRIGRRRYPVGID